MNRRAILQLGALSAFAAAAPRLWTPYARAEELEDRYFIFCYFKGGWDLLLSLDPRDPGEFRDDLKKTTLIQPGFERLSSSYDELIDTGVDGMVFGPCMGGLVDHASRLTLVRGMSMDTLTHEVGRRRFLTGHPPAGLQAVGSSLATLLAATLGTNEPIPQLSVRVESYNSGQPGWSSAIRVNSVEDLARALSPSAHPLAQPEQRALDALFDHLEAQESSPWRQEAYASRRNAQDLVALGLDEQFDFLADRPEMAELRELYGIDGDLSAPAAQAATAVTAITSGISRCVSIEAGTSLDTHGPEWATAHPRALREGFDRVGAILTDLERRAHPDGGTWLDKTTVIAFSEFGRTPLVNSSGGRDHFLHNACLLAGGGLPGGRVLGRSSDTGMNPLPLDLVTGAEDEAGEIVKPEHLFRALLQDVGITEDIGGVGVAPFTALLG